MPFETPVLRMVKPEPLPEPKEAAFCHPVLAADKALKAVASEPTLGELMATAAFGPKLRPSGFFYGEIAEGMPVPTIGQVMEARKKQQQDAMKAMFTGAPPSLDAHFNEGLARGVNEVKGGWPTKGTI